METPSQSPAPSETPTSAASEAPESVPVFVGTQREFDEAQRLCAERYGFATTKQPQGFSIDDSGHTQDEFTEMVDGCGQEVGTPDLMGMPDEELRVSYDLRVAMQDCLVENGVSTEPPPSWETFRDQWRAGDYWEPIVELQAQDIDAKTYGITVTCDLKDGTVW